MLKTEYSFITDINHKPDKLFNLLQLLNNPSLLISKNIYKKYKTVFKYSYIINDLISTTEIKQISDLINEISYIPLLVSTLPTNNISNIITFLPEIINKNYNIYFHNIKPLYRENSIEFSFYLDGSQIYIPNELYIYIDLSIYEGYSFIGSDELIPMILSEVVENLDIKLINNLYAINNDQYVDWLEFIDSQKHKLRSHQLFTLKSNNSDDIASWTELAYYWGGIIKRIDNTVIIQNTIPLDMTPQAWYIINGKKIVSGSIPTYRFDPFNELDISMDPNIDINEPLLKYYTTLSYIKLFTKYPELINFIDKISIYQDGTIELPLFNYEQFKNFISTYQVLFNTNKIYQLKLKNVSEGLSILYEINNSVFLNIISANKGSYPNNQLSSLLITTSKDEMFIVSDHEDVENVDIKKAQENFNKFLNNNNLNLEYFNKDNITKSLINITIPTLDIKAVNIYKDEIYDSNSKIISYNVGISENDFLLENYNIYFLTDKQQTGYSNELMLSEYKDTLFINDEILQPIYEGKLISDVDIKNMWKNGDFMKDWNKFVYKNSGLFSRVNLIYYVS